MHGPNGKNFSSIYEMRVCTASPVNSKCYQGQKRGRNYKYCPILEKKYGSKYDIYSIIFFRSTGVEIIHFPQITDKGRSKLRSIPNTQHIGSTLFGHWCPFNGLSQLYKKLWWWKVETHIRPPGLGTKMPWTKKGYRNRETWHGRSWWHYTEICGKWAWLYPG